MKSTKFTSALLAGLVLSAIACTNSKTAKSVETSAKNTTSETISENGQVVSEKLSYRFSEDGCDTEMQSFTSREEMCAGLQDEKRNNFCSPEARENRFKEVCSGAFKPFVSDSMGTIDVDKHTPDINQAPQAVAPTASDKMAVKEFKTKEAGLEVFKLGPSSVDGGNNSAMTIISCDSNPMEIVASKRNGILLLPSSKIVVARDLKYIFKDGSSTENVQPFSTTSCGTQEGEKTVDLTTLDKNLFQIRELRNASTVYDVILTSPEGQGENQSGLVAVGCGDDITYPMRAKMNGIYLTRGSSIVFARDLSGKFIDVHGSMDKTPYVVFSCK